jgi:hypothetical protein
MIKIIYITLIIVFTQGCEQSAESSYNSGYHDGLVEGYNTICKFNSSKKKGDWNNKNYTKGYSVGQADGAAKGASAARADNCKAAGYY